MLLLQQFWRRCERKQSNHATSSALQFSALHFVEHFLAGAVVQVLRLSTGTVHYTMQGDGVPRVLLHAIPGDGREFDAVIPALAQSTRVRALDWLGYGRSDVPADRGSVTVLRFYKVLREIISALALPPAFFIGNFGVQARQRCSAVHSVRAAVCPGVRPIR